MTTTAAKAGQRELAQLKGTALRVATLAAIASLAVACTDSPTTPRPTSVGASAIDPAHASVVLHRTTESVADDGTRVVKRRTVVQQLRAVPHGQQAVPNVDALGLGEASTHEQGDLPLPVISSPARLQTSACGNEREWTRSVPVPSIPGAVAVATGSGDAPATRVQLVQNGQVIGEVTRSWVRMSRSWQLSRQEMTVASRHYRDVVEVERQPAAGRALEAPLPIFACLARDSAATAREEAALDPFGSYHSASMPAALAAPSAPRELAECTSDGMGDNCQDKRDLKFAADVAYVGASLLVAVACPTLVLVRTEACIKAIGTLGTTIAAELAANHALERCIEEQRAKQKACECAGGVAMENRSGDGQMTPAVQRWLAPAGGAAYFDCDDTGFSGDDSDVTWQDNFDVSTPPDPGSGGVYVCVYEVDYDLETGEVEVYPLYCYVEWME